MSTFNNGSGDLVSTNYPAALLELAQKLQAAEIAAAIDNVQITFDSDAGTAAIAAAIPSTFTVSATTGNIEISGNNYISGDTFNPGTGGDLVKTSKSAAFLELAQKVQNAEAAAGADNVQLTFDADGLSSTIAATLPTAFAVNATSGIVEITASDYLP